MTYRLCATLAQNEQKINESKIPGVCVKNLQLQNNETPIEFVKTCKASLEKRVFSTKRKRRKVVRLAKLNRLLRDPTAIVADKERCCNDLKGICEWAERSKWGEISRKSKKMAKLTVKVRKCLYASQTRKCEAILYTLRSSICHYAKIHLSFTDGWDRSGIWKLNNHGIRAILSKNQLAS